MKVPGILRLILLKKTEFSKTLPITPTSYVIYDVKPTFRTSHLVLTLLVTFKVGPRVRVRLVITFLLYRRFFRTRLGKTFLRYVRVTVRKVPLRTLNVSKT